MAALDHVVINTLRGMDGAAELFAALGFTLTPRGHHSLGSINHLMMTAGAYLELVGVPEHGLQRQEVLDSPFGLSGLVVKTDDAEATFSRLAAAGFPALPPMDFSRPVALDGRQEDARFRTVRLPKETFPAGRVYFCQHFTPELVWRAEWMEHPNGFCGIDGVQMDSPDADTEAARLAAAFGAVAAPAGAGWRVTLADAAIDVIPGAARFASARLVFSTLEDIEQRAVSLPAARWERQSRGEALLLLPDLGVRLVCRSIA